MTGQQLVVEAYDPGDLLTNANIADRRPDNDLIESIRDIGVLQPIIATRTADGFVRVRMGHRRTMAAIEAGRETVPVIVVADEADYDDQADAQLDRLLAQYAENEHRQPLTAADKAAVAVQLLDLGLSARQVTARTRMRPADVNAARAIRQSGAATAAVTQQPQLTMDQAAAIAEFDTDAATVGKLLEAAADGHGQFTHILQRHRNDRASAQARTALAANLTADGITIATEHPDYNSNLIYLTSPDGKKITPSAHKKCPGNVAWLAQGYGRDNKPTWEAAWYCTNPRANGHRSTLSSGSTDPEKARAERRETIARNKEWRAAEQVRRAWLREFLARKTAPDGALRYVLTAVAAADGPLHRALSQNHECARELLGLNPAKSKWSHDTEAVTDLLARAADGRASVIVLGLILGATEGEITVQVPVAPRAYPNVAAYLAALAGWGYGLSDTEQRVVDACTAAAAKDGA